MVEVLEQIRKPRKRQVGNRASSLRVDPKIMELQTAKRILAEVFKIRISDVEEMIRIRYEEKVMWPERFYLEE